MIYFLSQTAVDATVITIVVLILLIIIFARFIFPRLNFKKWHKKIKDENNTSNKE